MSIFVAYLHGKGYSASSLPRILAAISYCHKMLELADPTKSFLISKLISGAKSMHVSKGSRLPITRPVLDKLYQAASQSLPLGFDRVAFRAAITLGFAAYMRIGEMFHTGRTNNCLELSDLQLIGSEMQISMTRFKSVKVQGAQTIRICSQIGPLCPVQNMKAFLRHRGEKQGHLFASPGGSAITRRTFDIWLRASLLFIGLDPARFKGHSLRIGAASQAALDGKSDAFIRLAGRWASDAFRQYIRVL